MQRALSMWGATVQSDIIKHHNSRDICIVARAKQQASGRGRGRYIGHAAVRDACLGGGQEMSKSCYGERES